MNPEREILILVCAFLADKQIVVSDEKSIDDMLSRYQNPPFTLHYRAAMRMTITDTNRLNWLLQKAHEILTKQPDTLLVWDNATVEEIKNNPRKPDRVIPLEQPIDTP